MGTPMLNYNPNIKVEENLEAMIPYLNHMLAHLSSRNVKRLDTNETVIKSRNGETYINGPKLEMRDASGNLRLTQGLDLASGLFVFAIANALGNAVFGMNDAGQGLLGDQMVQGNLSADTATYSFVNQTLGLVQLILDATNNFTILTENNVTISTGGNTSIDAEGTCIVDGATSTTVKSAGNIAFYHGSVSPFVSIASGAVDDTLVLKSGKAGIKMTPAYELDVTGATRLNGNLGFFNTTPVAKTSVTDPSAVVTTQTADATYDTTEMDMLNNLKSDVTNLQSKLTSLINSLQALGLI
jgi:hypothetical protein